MTIRFRFTTLSVALVAGVALAQSAPVSNFNAAPPNGANQKPAFAGQTRAPVQNSNVSFRVDTLVDGVDHPWGLAFLPDGRMLLTERAGRLRIVGPDGRLSAPVAGLPDSVVRSQGGLLGIALDPAYARNNLIYWSFSEPSADGKSNNTAVARGRLVDGAAPRVDNVQVIFHQQPSLDSNLHFGGRLVFAPDGTLFITTGERSITAGRMQAQRLDGLLGKVVRVNADGSIPADNPFVGRAGVRPEIWSYGHRNIEGAALNPATGKLWTVEHGTRGGDELNIPAAGKDYGWPTIAYGIEYNGQTITGGETQHAGMEQPIYYWDPVIAPSGMAFYTGSMFPAWKGSVFIGGLGSTSLVRLALSGDRVVGEERFLTDRKERIRDVVQGPDGALYLLTDDDKGKVLRLSAAS